jgi:hypothetical protein
MVAFQIKNKLKGLKKNKLEVAYNIAENVTNYRAKQQENSNYNDSDQYENQSIFYQTLTFFTRKK